MYGEKISQKKNNMTSLESQDYFYQQQEKLNMTSNILVLAFFSKK